MNKEIKTVNFRNPDANLAAVVASNERLSLSTKGLKVTGAAEKKTEVFFDGKKFPVLHTRNGDAIELEINFEENNPTGRFAFGFHGGTEDCFAVFDLHENEVRLEVTDFRFDQPVDRTALILAPGSRHSVRLEKTEGAGKRVKMANIAVYLDGNRILGGEELDLVPEMSAVVEVQGSSVTLGRVTHSGTPMAIPEKLRVGGLQMIQVPDIEANLQSILRGLKESAEIGIQLLVTPETSLTGLFPRDDVTYQEGAIANAERQFTELMKSCSDFPYLVVGLPEWREEPNRRIRYNISRVYAPDGSVVASCPKIHSCEWDFHHGRLLNEFDIHGVPTSLHICHDGRYPDVWTLPVMFGTRLVLHPLGGFVGTSRTRVDAIERSAAAATANMHAFYMAILSGGGSYLAGPHNKNEPPIMVSDECRRDNPDYPMTGPVKESLFHAEISVHEAFGYWPARSYRTSEAVAEAYENLYRSYGGKRLS